MSYKKRIIDSVKTYLRKENLNEIVVNILGQSIMQGFVCEIILVGATGLTTENKQKHFHLAVKHLRKEREQMKSARNACRIEYYIYSTLFPSLREFLSGKNIINELFSVPKCYKCVNLDIGHIIIMENLLYKGYELNDKKHNLNMSHLKMILKEFSKLHAISFAFRNQKPELFRELTNFIVQHDFLRNDVLSHTIIRASLSSNLVTAIKMLNDHGDNDLYHKLSNVFINPPIVLLADILNTEEKQTAICHGDCWNDNFLFKYKGEDKSTPTNVKIIDWQMSGVRSPVFDLSFFIYSSASQEELEKFDELLEYYYENFSTFLMKQGSNPQELFTFDDLKRHWRKYAISGLILSLNSLKVQLSDKIAEMPECTDECTSAVFDLPLNDISLYYSRLKSIVNHYFSSTG